MKLNNTILIALGFLSINSMAQNWAKNISSGTSFGEVQKQASEYFSKKSDKKSADYQSYKRWEYFAKNRLDESGNLVPGSKLLEAYQNKKAKNGLRSTFSASWEYIGNTSVPVNGGGAGRINTMEFDPQNPVVIWVGAANGGLWRSGNGGQTWTTSTDFLPNLSVSDIAINPDNTNEIYVATGDNNGYEQGLSFWGGTYSSGLLKSINGGNSWTTTGLSFNTTDFNIIKKIVLFPDNPQNLLVAHRNGIERTADGGATWTNVRAEKVYDFKINPANPNTVYAVGNGVCLTSVDQGVNWTSTQIDSTWGKMSIAISPANPNKIYVLNVMGDLFLSTDNASSFTLVANIANDSIITFAGDYDCTIAVSPGNAEELYAGGIDLAKSMDGGLTWTRKSDILNPDTTNYIHRNHHAIEFLPGSSNTLFSCNDGGISKSANNGDTWTDISSNLAIAQYYRIGTAQSKPSEYYLGQQDNGVVVCLSGNFVYVMPGNGTESAVDKYNSGHAMVSYQNGNLFQTYDNWSTYTVITVPSDDGAFVTPLQLNEQKQTTVFVAYNEVYKSYDFGLTWDSLSAFGTDNEIEVMSVAPSDSNYIYLGNDDAFYYSHDGGATWTKSVNGSISANNYNFITAIAVSSTDPLKLWMTYSGFVSGEKVFSSTDGGVTWTNISGSLPNIPCNTIVVQPNSNGELYLGTDLGVYYKNGTMTDWTPFQAGLPNVIVNELEIVTSLNAIRAATFGRGVWQSPLNNPIVLSNESDKSKAELENKITVYPNPAGSVLNIRSTSIEPMTFSIYNTLGQCVLEGKTEGINPSINLDGLSEGIYQLHAKTKQSGAVTVVKFCKGGSR
ncbi:MAG: T9SS type A sorting domain-containing protein [Bacteroidia bacterium]